MTISINTNRTLFTVSSTLLDSFISSPSSYQEVEIVGYFNTTDTPISEIYNEDALITALTNVATSAGVETIKPAFFDTTVFEQGVYHFIVNLKSEARIQTDEGCIFVEDGLDCSVDTFRLREDVDIVKRLMAGIDYYLLKNSQECPCLCDKLTDIYNELVDTIDPQTCQSC